ncbi:unnamed protein product [Diatraea saccharalis]|uniref:C2H2-type domain-containing protein n=1 Tax=Diatraea saccharalis TaxID=40085 RepID=A0A9N9R322_9NEOP|nr:unnamed protein product [Diatraea saccharalis]
MSSSPFPYTCELCGAEGLTDEGMRSHTLEAHVAGRPECPFCDCAVPQPQLVSHVQRAHLHYLTPERELMAFIDDQSPSYDEDSKMTTTDSCSYNTPGSINGWHSPDTSSSYHSGAISKNINYQNGFQEKEGYRNDYKSEKDDDKYSRSPKNINLSNGLKNININNGVIPKKIQSRQNSNDGDSVNGYEKKGAHSSPSHNSNNYEGSPNKSKLAMASAGQGSPLRSQLALKLKANTPKKSVPTPSPTVQCLLCDFKSTCPRKLEEHINRAHFDLTSPSVLGNANANSENPTLTGNNPTLTLDNPTLALSAMALSPGPHGSTFQCPICEKEFSSGPDVEVHVNVEHRDILSPQKSDQVDNASCEDVVMTEESPVSNCPVCCQPLPLSQHELIQHIEEHFERGEESGAVALTAAEREAQRSREEHEFQLLRAQYGMEEDEEGYTNRATNSLKRAVYSGALSVAGYYERSVGLRKASALGRDTGSSRTDDRLIILFWKIKQEEVKDVLKDPAKNAPDPIHKIKFAPPKPNPGSDVCRVGYDLTFMSIDDGKCKRFGEYSGEDSVAECSEPEHSTHVPVRRRRPLRQHVRRPWLGLRVQMVLSSLLRHPPYAALLGGAAAEGGGVPAIPRLQLLVERAWAMGIDTQGSEQLGSKLHNTRKWIGACEVVTVLSSFRIKCQLIDFHKPTGEDGSHPALFDWVLRYFRDDPTAYKAPLYLQHQGHSRTIIGYEKHKDGKATLLVLDPSHSPAQVRQVLCGGTSAGAAALRLLRRGSCALRARQYQLLCVTGVISTEQEFQMTNELVKRQMEILGIFSCGSGSGSGGGRASEISEPSNKVVVQNAYIAHLDLN